VSLSTSAAQILNRPSVAFDTDRRYNNQNAWPFFYAFVPYPYHDTNKLNGGQGLIGIKCPAGQITDIPIRLDRDSVYRQLNARYTVYKEAIGSELGITITTTAGSRVATVSDTSVLAVKQPVAFLSATGIVHSGVISRIISATSIAFEQVVSISVAGATAYNRQFEYFDSPVLPPPTNTVTALSGTIEVAANQNPPIGDGYTVIGTLTAFTTELKVGSIISFIDSDGNTLYATVKTITDDLTLEINTRLPIDVEVFAGTGINLITEYTPLVGDISVAEGILSINGTATSFDTELNDGDLIRAIPTADIPEIYMIDTVVDPTTIIPYNTPEKTITSRFYEKVGSVLSGAISCTTSSKIITGIASAFTTELKVGSVVAFVNGSIFYVTVDKIISDTEFTTASFPVMNNQFDIAAVVEQAADFNFALADDSTLHRDLTDFVKVSFVLLSQQGRYLYGGTQTITDRTGNMIGLNECPLPISALQGERDGLGQLRTPSLQPYEGVVNVKVFNKSDTDVFVNGCLFGYKITFNRDDLHE